MFSYDACYLLVFWYCDVKINLLAAEVIVRQRQRCHFSNITQRTYDSVSVMQFIYAQYTVLTTSVNASIQFARYKTVFHKNFISQRSLRRRLLSRQPN